MPKRTRTKRRTKKIRGGNGWFSRGLGRFSGMFKPNADDEHRKAMQEAMKQRVASKAAQQRQQQLRASNATAKPMTTPIDKYFKEVDRAEREERRARKQVTPPVSVPPVRVPPVRVPFIPPVEHTYEIFRNGHRGD